MENVSGFNGFLFGGAIAGTLTLAAGEAHVVNAHAAAAGSDSVTVDYDDNAVSGFFPGWEGSVVISNHSHASSKDGHRHEVRYGHARPNLHRRNDCRQGRGNNRRQ